MDSADWVCVSLHEVMDKSMLSFASDARGAEFEALRRNKVMLLQHGVVWARYG